ncbi:MAG: TIGR04282 family arsenosugar biosynthesis glycosyltransferase [Saprospiraceae bacterium]
MEVTETALIIFVKNREVGKVKTRLAKTVGDEKALEVYCSLLEKLKNSLIGFKSRIYVYYSAFFDVDDEWNSLNPIKKLQIPGDLGDKMSNAITTVKSGARKVMIVGSDCPELSQNIIEEGFFALDDHDVVLGPALDGGYYLIGLKAENHALFLNMNWSTSTVLAETIRRATEQNLSVHLLTTLRDLDEYEDYIYFREKGIL